MGTSSRQGPAAGAGALGPGPRRGGAAGEPSAPPPRDALLHAPARATAGRRDNESARRLRPAAPNLTPRRSSRPIAGAAGGACRGQGRPPEGTAASDATAHSRRLRRPGPAVRRGSTNTITRRRRRRRKRSRHWGRTLTPALARHPPPPRPCYRRASAPGRLPRTPTPWTHARRRAVGRTAALGAGGQESAGEAHPGRRRRPLLLPRPPTHRSRLCEAVPSLPPQKRRAARDRRRPRRPSAPLAKTAVQGFGRGAGIPGIKRRATKETRLQDPLASVVATFPGLTGRRDPTSRLSGPGTEPTLHR